METYLHNTMTISNLELLLRQFLDALWSGNTPPDKLPPLMLWGAPGVGKSSIIRALAQVPQWRALKAHARGRE